MIIGTGYVTFIQIDATFKICRTTCRFKKIEFQVRLLANLQDRTRRDDNRGLDETYCPVFEYLLCRR